MRWRITGFVENNGNSVIETWQSNSDKRACAKFEQRIRVLRDRMFEDWHYDYAHKLSDAEKLFEIKFEASKVAHRPLCMFGPADAQITILLFAVEHNGKWRPPGAIKSAISRKDAIQDGTARTKDYDPDE